ncbi:retropepsin-like aspartic protease [Massilia sp. GCM10023247]|uniref:retropepsin-like aspartic protease n=1 Tax=Massilia sp. GCM10023247 TaxID=3252643 RepID=UPI003621E530
MGEQATIPLRFAEDLRPVGEAVVNGSTVPVMLSTGSAESLVFNKKTLDRLGVEVRSSTSTLFPSDERNPTGAVLLREIAYAFVDDFSFGPFKRKKASYLVEDFMDDTFAIRAGAGNLLQTDVELALDAGYLKFFTPQGCFREHLAYWDLQAVAVPAMGDVWKRDPRLVFKVRIAGNDVLAILSTGTPHSYLPKPTAERLGLSASSPGATREPPVPGHGPDQPVWKVPVPSLSIGALDVKNLDLRVMDLPQEGEILVLGADFLHRYRVYVARSQMQFYFSPIDAPKALKRGSVKVIPSAPE